MQQQLSKSYKTLAFIITLNIGDFGPLEKVKK